MSGFKAFLMRGNVVDLAIAVVIGAAFGALVKAFVDDIITPIIGAFGGLPDFSAWFFTINGSKFMIGDFINALIAFVILAAIIYFLVVLPFEKLMARFKVETSAEPVATRECPYCLSKIPVAASRCAFCTTDFAANMEAANVTAGMGLVGQPSAQAAAFVSSAAGAPKSGVSVERIRGIDEALAQKFHGLQIIDTGQLLERARTTALRRDLAGQLGLDPKAVLELANRADLMRIKGVVGAYADLLENAGVDTVRELAHRVPENLQARIEQVNADMKLTSQTPSLDEIQAWVAEAKTLPAAIEY